MQVIPASPKNNISPLKDHQVKSCKAYNMNRVEPFCSILDVSHAELSEIQKQRICTDLKQIYGQEFKTNNCMNGRLEIFFENNKNKAKLTCV